MGGSIFFVDENEKAIELKEAKYESEDLFQRLIEQYPGILAGDQINPNQPRKWIFISREMGVPEHEGGSAQWFLDHLFIDQDAIPTFVEVKRSTDTRIRREVVAQMLDYAANAVVYWPVEQLRDTYVRHCRELDVSPLEELALSAEDTEVFWDKVDANLRLGKLRLLFVADEIPDSLRRIIEFLNKRMADIDVLGLEIKQYVSGENQRTLVPKIIGKIAAAEQVKSRTGFVWTEESYLEKVKQNSGGAVAEVCQKLLREFEKLGCWTYWGKGQTQGGFVPVYEGKQRHQLCAVYSYNNNTKVEIYFQHFKAPFDSTEQQRKLLQRFNAIPGIQIPDSKLFKRPSIDCSILTKPENFKQYIKIYEDMLADIHTFEAKV